MGTIRELSDLGVGFVSLNETLDLTTPAGKSMAGMLTVFAEFERDILRKRVKAGIAHSRAKGIVNGRPVTARSKLAEVLKLKANGMNHSQFAKKPKIGRTSVIRFINESKRKSTSNQKKH